MINNCKYKLVAFRVEDNKKWNEKYGNNLECFIKELKKPYQNYYHKLYEKENNKWVEMNI